MNWLWGWPFKTEASYLLTPPPRRFLIKWELLAKPQPAACFTPDQYFQRKVPPQEKLQPVSMAQEFVNGKIQCGKVVVFIKPTCPYCRKTQEILSQLPFKQGLLEFVDITATNNTNAIQDYLQQLTGARTVPRVFIGKDCIGGCSDLVSMQQSGELTARLKQIGALQL